MFTNDHPMSHRNDHPRIIFYFYCIMVKVTQFTASVIPIAISDPQCDMEALSGLSTTEDVREQFGRGNIC